MSVPQEVIDWLMVSSMIFFNIFCLLGIIALIVVISAANRIRGKAVETMDMVQETTTQVGKTVEEKSFSFLSELLTMAGGMFFARRRESLVDKILKSWSKK
jgi:hypothetical protein